MAEYLSPAVYVEEIPSGNKPIQGLGTSTCGFVGHAPKGPVGEARLWTVPHRTAKLNNGRPGN
jgi:phage tail sheath protein FI